MEGELGEWAGSAAPRGLAARAAPPGESSCRSCGGPLGAGTRFCTSCGAGVPAWTPPAAADPAGQQNTPPPATGSQPAHRGRVVALGAGLAVAAIAIGVVATRGSSGSEGYVDSRRIPTAAQERWRTDVDGVASVAADDETVYVSSRELDDDELVVSALAAETGEERWQTSLDVATDGFGYVVDPVDGGGVLVATYGSGDYTVLLLDRDGEVVWERDASASPGTRDGRTYLLEYDADVPPVGAQLIDLHDGQVGPRRRAERGFTWADDVVVGLDEGEVRLYDPATLQPVGGPIDVDDDIWTVSAVNDLVVGVGGDDLYAYSRGGDERWQARSPVGSTHALRAIGSQLLLSGEDGTALVDLTRDGIREVWVDNDFLLDAVESDDVVAVVDGDELRILDRRTGEERARVEGEYTSESGPFALVPGAVLLTDGDGDTEVISFDGERLWAADGYLYEIGDGWAIGGVVDSGETTVAYYR